VSRWLQREERVILDPPNFNTRLTIAEDTALEYVTAFVVGGPTRPDLCSLHIEVTNVVVWSRMLVELQHGSIEYMRKIEPPLAAPAGSLVIVRVGRVSVHRADSMGPVGSAVLDELSKEGLGTITVVISVRQKSFR